MRNWIQLSEMNRGEIEAAAMVELCIRVVMDTLAHSHKGEIIHFFATDLHTHFSLFTESLGLSGSLYRISEGKCPAVSIYLDGKEEFISFFNLMDDEEIRKKLDERADGEAIRRAALMVAKSLRSNWIWPE